MKTVVLFKHADVAAWPDLKRGEGERAQPKKSTHVVIINTSATDL